MSAPLIIVLSAVEEYQQLIVIENTQTPLPPPPSSQMKTVINSTRINQESNEDNKLGNKERNYICNVCQKTFNNRQNISRHMIRIHKIRRGREACSKNISCNEDGCSNTFSSVKDLKSHLVKMHNFHFSECIEEFCSLREFTEWKKKFESSFNVSFVQHSGSKKCCTKNVIYLYCHKSGDFESHSKGHRRRRSNKVGFSCTATMKVTVDNLTKKVTIYFCNDHYGH